MKKHHLLLIGVVIIILGMASIAVAQTDPSVIPVECGECTSDTDCAEGTICNATDLCLISCECPECDVCAGHCIPKQQDCSSNADCTDSDFCLKTPGDCPGQGICAPKPTACPDVWQPVCGCDGKTYGNACEASAAGASVAHEGECTVECGECTSDADCPSNTTCNAADICLPLCSSPQLTVCSGYCVPVDQFCSSNTDCLDSEFCKKPAGDCSGRGECTTRPEACIEIYAPVCGCDGKTYGNACEAASAGVSVANDGECKNICENNADCDAGLYCEKAPGDCNGIGTCKDIPQICPLFFDPVCGCDGKTYGNSCEAAAAGVPVLHEGPCEERQCFDGIDNDRDGLPDCEDPDCIGVEDGECATDLPGICAMGVRVCTDTGEVCKPRIMPGDRPEVCGNDIDENCNGLLDDGCECRSNEDCGTGLFCSKPEGKCSGPGKCTGIPQGCPKVLDPVCGCDGKTYENKCLASAAGVSIAHEGECLTGGYFCDMDEDKYISDKPVVFICSPFVCGPPGCQTTPGDDCDDDNPRVNPGADEICNGIDDDCDGLIDESNQVCTCSDAAWELQPGFNLVGGLCTVNEITAFRLLEKLGGETVVSSIMKFDPATGSFVTANYEEGQPAGVDFPIKAGEGYIIYMKNDVTGFQP